LRRLHPLSSSPLVSFPMISEVVSLLPRSDGWVGFRVWGLGFMALSLGFRIRESGFEVGFLGLGVTGSYPNVPCDVSGRVAPASRTPESTDLSLNTFWMISGRARLNRRQLLPRFIVVAIHFDPPHVPAWEARKIEPITVRFRSESDSITGILGPPQGQAWRISLN
jgi:hypothetical protein